MNEGLRHFVSERIALRLTGAVMYGQVGSLSEPRLLPIKLKMVLAIIFTPLELQMYPGLALNTLKIVHMIRSVNIADVLEI